MSDSEEYESNFVEQIINSENNSDSDNNSNESEDEESIQYNLNLQIGASIFDVENQLNNNNIWTQTINMSNNDTISEESAEEMSTDYNNNESGTISNPITITDNLQGNTSSLLTNSALLTPLHTNTTFTNISIPDILNNNNTQNNTFFPSTPPGPPPAFTITEPDENIQNDPQYSMLHNNDVDNPFSKCNISPLNYDTDDEETDHLRVIFFWNYEINYEYFNLGNLLIFHSKNESFNSQLNELKNIRNKSTNNLTGKIFKLNNIKNFKNQDLVNIYLIAYYDNVKTDIELYGIFNQELDETKLIDNIKRENIYGVKGNIYNTTHTNLGDNDFIVIHRKVAIF